MGKIKEPGRKKIFDGQLLYTRKSIRQNKETKCIAKFGDTEILIDTDDILADYITLKNVVILIITSVNNMCH